MNAALTPASAFYFTIFAKSRTRFYRRNVVVDAFTETFTPSYSSSSSCCCSSCSSSSSVPIFDPLHRNIVQIEFIIAFVFGLWLGRRLYLKTFAESVNFALTKLFVVVGASPERSNGTSTKADFSPLVFSNKSLSSHSMVENSSPLYRRTVVPTPFQGPLQTPQTLPTAFNF